MPIQPPSEVCQSLDTLVPTSTTPTATSAADSALAVAPVTPLAISTTITYLKTSAQRLETIYQRYYDLVLGQVEGVDAGHTHAEPYLRIALKAEHQLKQTLALLAQLEATAAVPPQPSLF